MAEFISVAEASERLGVIQRRVRAMIADGVVPAERVGKAYLIDGAAVDRLALRSRPRGRPLSAANAWALLALLSGREQAVASRPRSSVHRLMSFRKQRPEAVVDELIRAEPRAVVHRWRVLPRDLDRLLHDERLIKSALCAAAPGIDIAYEPGRDGLDAYALEGDVDELRRRLRPIEPADAPNMRLRVPVGSDWIFHEPVAPLAVVAADLLVHLDPRVVRAARNAIDELVRDDRAP